MVQRFRFKNVKLTFYLSDSFSSIEKNIVLNKHGLVNKMLIKYTEKN